MRKKAKKEKNMDPRKQGSRQENGKVYPKKTEKMSPRLHLCNSPREQLIQKGTVRLLAPRKDSI